MADKGKKEGHKCPPEPWPKPNVLMTPSYNDGESFAAAKAKWFAHVRRCNMITPMPRNTR